MKALIKEINKNLQLKNILENKCMHEDDVYIEVKYVGLCRTDLFVSEGIIPVDFNIIIGHEFSGIVLESKSKYFKKGDKVVVNPYFGERGFMGLHFDGCLQEKIIVPAKQIIKNQYLDYKIAAYLEPISASMAVLKACKNKKKKGSIWGNNRIAELTYIILKNEGYNIEWIKDYNVRENQYDYAIETMFEEIMIESIIKSLKIGGTMIVKSRKTKGTLLFASQLVSKELTLKCVNYYPFEKAMFWLEKNHSKIAHLLGEEYHIKEWKKAFQKAKEGESKKIFIYFGE